MWKRKQCGRNVWENENMATIWRKWRRKRNGEYEYNNEIAWEICMYVINMKKPYEICKQSRRRRQWKRNIENGNEGMNNIGE